MSKSVRTRELFGFGNQCERIDGVTRLTHFGNFPPRMKSLNILRHLAFMRLFARILWGSVTKPISLSILT